LALLPEVVAVTFTLIVHEAPAANVPPLKAMLPLPAVAVTVPPHVALKPFGVATIIPAGKVSVNATPVNAALPWIILLIVNVSVLVPFTAIVDGANDLKNVGAGTGAATLLHRENFDVSAGSTPWGCAPGTMTAPAAAGFDVSVAVNTVCPAGTGKVNGPKLGI